MCLDLIVTLSLITDLFLTSCYITLSTFHINGTVCKFICLLCIIMLLIVVWKYEISLTFHILPWKYQNFLSMMLSSSKHRFYFTQKWNSMTEQEIHCKMKPADSHPLSLNLFPPFPSSLPSPSFHLPPHLHSHLSLMGYNSSVVFMCN